MSERQTDYHTQIAWQRVARDLEVMVLVEAERNACDNLQRAADLLALAEWTERPERELKIFRLRHLLVVVLDSLIGPAYVFEGANAIAEAAAFVRQNGGGE